jgi:hypothetical protein
VYWGGGDVGPLGIARRAAGWNHRLPVATPNSGAYSAAEPTRGKRLLEFAWDEPDTAVMRRHVAEMEATPIDGVVFHPRAEILWQSQIRRNGSTRDRSGTRESTVC